MESAALEQLAIAIPAKNLVSDDFVSFLGTVDVMLPSNDIRSKERLPYLDHIALKTEAASARLKQILQQGSDLLPISVRTASTQLLQAPYVTASSARPTVLRRLSPRISGTILPGKNDPENLVNTNYIEFVRLADSLRQLVTEP